MAGTPLATWELREFISAMGLGRHCAMALQSGSQGEGAARGLRCSLIMGRGAALSGNLQE